MRINKYMAEIDFPDLLKPWARRAIGIVWVSLFGGALILFLTDPGPGHEPKESPISLLLASIALSLLAGVFLALICSRRFRIAVLLPDVSTAFRESEQGFLVFLAFQLIGTLFLAVTFGWSFLSAIE